MVIFQSRNLQDFQGENPPKIQLQAVFLSALRSQRMYPSGWDA